MSLYSTTLSEEGARRSFCAMTPRELSSGSSLGIHRKPGIIDQDDPILFFDGSTPAGLMTPAAGDQRNTKKNKQRIRDGRDPASQGDVWKYCHNWEILPLSWIIHEINHKCAITALLGPEAVQAAAPLQGVSD